MLGQHILKTYSSTQPTISLSSGEAEFYGVVKAAGAALGQQSLFADLGIPLEVRVWTDSSAAIGICSRQGLGKLRHIDTQALWIQEKVRTRQIILKKVRGDVNPADLLTKHLGSKDKVDQLVNLYGCAFMNGRAKAAPLLKKKDAQKLEEAGSDQQMHVLDEIDEGRAVVVPEAELHDLNLWPHLHSQELMDRMFPTAVAAPEVETSDIGSRDELGHLHRRWAAKKIAITRG
jgi:hypothetical protein